MRALEDEGKEGKEDEGRKRSEAGRERREWEMREEWKKEPPHLNVLFNCFLL